MPQIIPIKDLKKTSELSQMCKEATEPIYITKNGYGDMVIMSMDCMSKKCSCLRLTRNLPLRSNRFRKERYWTPVTGSKV